MRHFDVLVDALGMFSTGNWVRMSASPVLYDKSGVITRQYVSWNVKNLIDIVILILNVPPGGFTDADMAMTQSV